MASLNRKALGTSRSLGDWVSRLRVKDKVVLSVTICIHLSIYTFGLFFFKEAHMCVYMSVYIFIYSKLANCSLVKGNPKASFSIATTSRYRRGCYFFPWTAPLTLDPYLILLSVKHGGIKYHFLSLWYDLTWDWTLVCQTIGKHSTHYTSGWLKYIHIYIYIYIYMQLKLIKFKMAIRPVKLL